MKRATRDAINKYKTLTYRRSKIIKTQNKLNEELIRTEQVMQDVFESICDCNRDDYEPHRPKCAIYNV